MPFRVREILLVSSPYDAFVLEEDGRLTERLFVQYSELNLTAAPRITHAPTGAKAMELLAARRFDLVITMVRLDDVDVRAFGRRVKELHPALPVALLAFHEADLLNLPKNLGRDAIDGVFVWTGDAQILLAIIKLIEDEKNVAYDTKVGGVRVILVVEDSVRHYSSFLSALYAELMKQSSSLSADGVNEAHKLMRMRARPKIALATSFEEAEALVAQYEPYVLAVISDVRFPRAGKPDPEAGLDLVRVVRAHDPDLPILLQSADAGTEELADAFDVRWVDKNSSSLRRQIRRFVRESLGFGDFVFRLPDRTEVGRARDMFEMEKLLAIVPPQSLEFHATRNHFSLWFTARSLFHLAELLRPRTIADFRGIEAVRAHLLEVIRQARIHELEGMITDFSFRQPGSDSSFVRVGKGSIGGKARGIAFVNTILARQKVPGGLEVRTPRTVALGTEAFDRFLEENALHDELSRMDNDREVIERFLRGRLGEELEHALEVAFRDITGPFTVRSSSLLEDAQFQPFAGIYSTFMLPNNHPNPEVRFDELRRAIKAVYASTFSRHAKSYFVGMPHAVEDEKMGIVVEQIVGRAHGPRFYPDLSGVALSYNYYPVGHQAAEDGIAFIALGLGHTVVSGGKTLQFSPSNPTILPQFPSPSDYLADSQSSFFALDLSSPIVDFSAGPESSLRLFDLDAAEEDGTLALAGSVYSPHDDQIRDSLALPGPRVVTFNNILKWGAIPLAPALRELLVLLRRGFGCPVEMEFALDAGSPGDRDPCLYVLQVRPQATQLLFSTVDLDDYTQEDLLCRSGRALGHGVIDDIQDVVYVKRGILDGSRGARIARAIGALNDQLIAERAPYLLIGPGRWGSSDPRLGVPVEWSQIHGARVLVETDVDGRSVEPSQGSHFFHNITSHQVGYLSLATASRGTGASFLDAAWLDAQPSREETDDVRHVRLEHPLRILLDGRKSTGVVLRRGRD